MNLAFLRRALVFATILLSSASIGLSQNISLVNEYDPYSGQLGDVWGEGDIACVGVYSPWQSGYGVGIFSISNSVPVYLTNYYVSPTSHNQFEHGVVRNRIGYFASWSGGGLHIVSLTNAAVPVFLSKIGANSGTTHNGHDVVHTMFLERNFLYEADHATSVVKVFDVSNPHLPVFVRDIETTDTVKVHQITVVSNRLYTSGWGDLSTPGKTDIWDVEHIGTQPPILLGSIQTGRSAHSSWPTADNKILAICRETTGGELSIWSITNPAVPVLLSSILPASMGVEDNLPHNPVIIGNLLFVSWYQNGVQVYNIADPAKPVRVGAYDTRSTSRSANFQGNWGIFPNLGLNKLLLSDMQRGLMILDASAVVTGTNNYPPLLIQSPTSLTATSGFSATLTGVFTGSSLVYQWQRSGTNIPGANSSSYFIANVQVGDSGSYRLRATNGQGVVTSSTATLSVVGPPPLTPVITVQPQDTAVYPEGDAMFSVAATGGNPIGYQWRFNGVSIPNATGISYARTNVQIEDLGYYSVVVSNQFGSAVSTNAMLTLVDSPYISNVRVASGLRSAVVGWSTQIPANARVYYEPGQLGEMGAAMRSGVAGSFTYASYVDSATSTNHMITLSGLEPGTSYDLQIISSNGTNDFMSAVYSFTTAGDIIIDNDGATYTGGWTNGTSSSDKYGSDYQYAFTVGNVVATATATYRPNIPTSGRYNVYVWYPQGGNRPADAKYLVNYSGGSTNVTISQQVNGGTWVLIGANLLFSPGTMGFVRLSNNSGPTVTMADAVKFEYITSQDEPNGTTIPTWWRLFHFGGTTDAALDVDSDGYSTAKEYVIGTSPVDVLSHLQMTIDDESSTNVLITFFPMLSDRSYGLFTKQQVGGPTWQSNFNGTPPTNEDGHGLLSVPTSGDNQAFYRLRVEQGVGGLSDRSAATRTVKYSFTNEVVCGSANRVFVK